MSATRSKQRSCFLGMNDWTNAKSMPFSMMRSITIHYWAGEVMMDLNGDGKHDLQDDFLTQQMLDGDSSDKNPMPGGRSSNHGTPLGGIIYIMSPFFAWFRSLADVREQGTDEGEYQKKPCVSTVCQTRQNSIAALIFISWTAMHHTDFRKHFRECRTLKACCEKNPKQSE